MQSRTRLGHLLLGRLRPRCCFPAHTALKGSIKNSMPGYSTTADTDTSSSLFKPKSRAPSAPSLPSSDQSSALISGSASPGLVLEDGQPSEHLYLSKENPGNVTGSESDLLRAAGSWEASSGSGKPWGYLSLGAGAAAVVLFTAAVAASAEGDNDYASHGEELKIRLLTWKSSVANALENLKDTLVLGIQGVLDAGSATVVLIQFLATVLFQASDAATDGLNAWWRPKVASLIADVVAHENRRKSVVDAGNGRVLDWLLESVTGTSSVQNEAARALAYLLSDARTSEIVLGRPQALPHLLRFAESLHAETYLFCLYMAACTLKTARHGKKMLAAEPGNELSRGRSMLVASVMDIITSSCDVGGGPALKLPENVQGEDIATVLDVLREGGPLLNEERKNEVIHSIKADRQAVGGFRDQKWTKKGQQHGRWIKFGLWDDLQGPQVSVPLAAWALGALAQASSSNCEKIADLDKNGESLLTALQAPERTVKWHAAIVIKFLLQGEHNHMGPLAHTFSGPLLATAAQAGKLQDYALARVAIDALSACVFCNSAAYDNVLETGLPVMWELAKEAEVKDPVQVPLANTLNILTSTGPGLPLEESKKWASILLRWVCSRDSERETRSAGSHILSRVVDALGPSGIPISQTWLAMLLMDLVTDRKKEAVHTKTKAQKEDKALGLVQSQVTQAATVAATQLAKLIARETAIQTAAQSSETPQDTSSELPVADLLGLDSTSIPLSNKKEALPKVAYLEAATAVLKAIKALTELSAENSTYQLRIVEAGGLLLLRRLLLGNDYDVWAAAEGDQGSTYLLAENEHVDTTTAKSKAKMMDKPVVKPPLTTQIRKQAARLLSILSLQPAAAEFIAGDERLCSWLEDCADGQTVGNGDLKTRSYARTVLLNVSHMEPRTPISNGDDSGGQYEHNNSSPRFEDMVFLVNPESIYWKDLSFRCRQRQKRVYQSSPTSLKELNLSTTPKPLEPLYTHQEEELPQEQPVMDVVFVHGLCGGPFKTWRVSDDKMSTTDKIGLVETIDQDAGREGTCWPREWLSHDLPHSRLLTLKYKTNLSQWSGATLPLQEVSSMLLDKLISAGVGQRPTVFVTHSMGGLVVKQMLMQAAREKSRAHLVQQTGGIVFYSCPHFGSKLADMPWRMGYVLRPAPTIGELRSGSPRLEELNRFIRILHNKSNLEVLNFSETKVTPLVEGYGGLALRMEVVPIESAYPGYGDLVVLDGTDHVNSCKPLSRSDPAYTKTLELLQKLEAASYRLKS